MALTVSVVIGSVRPGRQGLRVAKFLVSKLETVGFKVHLIDPVELKLPLLVGRFDYLSEDQQTDGLKELKAKIVDSDAFVIVTPEYNHSYSPVVTNTLDYFFHNEYYYKVAGIATYSAGGFGGVRAAAPLRPVLACLGLTSIPKELPVPSVHSLLNEDGTVQEDAGKSGESLEKNAIAFAEELKFFATAIQTARASSSAP
ncbi:Aste57867_17527 [Aphanomyces stellatus]|uniref:Aste57867_17527 protein n=1 Tax=Aphanomyces stellatus TaxID=120398 RepID=A0A485L877_9STRA|nr:hypothetical protein As57867_017467 [Aphanomyces stellatus]VFT94280.1 Aste57867_17527 [Aphanomyces stellatus]